MFNSIPDSFLLREDRCGYTITEEMKSIWYVQMNLLEVFIEVCEKNDLSYYAICGTLLGAVRHNGYIPWDDDVDVAMPREDYELLCTKYKDEFQKPVELSIPNNARPYYEGWARLHNIETACFYPNFKTEGCHQGIYIDIFPIDGCNDSILVDKLIYNIVKFLNVIGHACTFNVNSNKILRCINKLYHKRIIKIKLNKIYDLVNRITQALYGKKYIGLRTCSLYRYGKLKFEKDWFKSYEYSKFEYLNIRIPSNYNMILAQIYGDYMQYPPLEKRGCWHSYIFNPNTPFKEFNMGSNVE